MAKETQIVRHPNSGNLSKSFGYEADRKVDRLCKYNMKLEKSVFSSLNTVKVDSRCWGLTDLSF